MTRTGKTLAGILAAMAFATLSAIGFAEEVITPFSPDELAMTESATDTGSSASDPFAIPGSESDSDVVDD